MSSMGSMRSPLMRPPAIGLVHWAGWPTPVERRQRLTDVARHAHAEGLALLETFEAGHAGRDDAVRDAVLSLAVRAEVGALVVAGPDSWLLARTIVRCTGMVLYPVAEETPMARIRDRQGWVQLVPRPAYG